MTYMDTDRDDLLFKLRDENKGLKKKLCNKDDKIRNMATKLRMVEKRVKEKFREADSRRSSREKHGVMEVETEELIKELRRENELLRKRQRLSGDKQRERSELGRRQSSILENSTIRRPRRISMCSNRTVPRSPNENIIEKTFAKQLKHKLQKTAKANVDLEKENRNLFNIIKKIFRSGTNGAASNTKMLQNAVIEYLRYLETSHSNSNGKNTCSGGNKGFEQLLRQLRGDGTDSVSSKIVNDYFDMHKINVPEVIEHISTKVKHPEGKTVTANENIVEQPANAFQGSSQFTTPRYDDNTTLEVQLANAHSDLQTEQQRYQNLKNKHKESQEVQNTTLQLLEDKNLQLYNLRQQYQQVLLDNEQMKLREKLHQSDIVSMKSLEEKVRRLKEKVADLRQGNSTEILEPPNSDRADATALKIQNEHLKQSLKAYYEEKKLLIAKINELELSASNIPTPSIPTCTKSLDVSKNLDLKQHNIGLHQDIAKLRMALQFEKEANKDMHKIMNMKTESSKKMEKVMRRNQHLQSKIQILKSQIAQLLHFYGDSEVSNNSNIVDVSDIEPKGNGILVSISKIKFDKSVDSKDWQFILGFNGKAQVITKNVGKKLSKHLNRSFCTQISMDLEELAKDPSNSITIRVVSSKENLDVDTQSTIAEVSLNIQSIIYQQTNYLEFQNVKLCNKETEIVTIDVKIVSDLHKSEKTFTSKEDEVLPAMQNDPVTTLEELQMKEVVTYQESPSRSISNDLPGQLLLNIFASEESGSEESASYSEFLSTLSE